MTVIRLSNEKTEGGKYFVQSYHERAEVLTPEQKAGTIETGPIPTRPVRAGYAYRLAADEAGSFEWVETKTVSPAAEQMAALVSAGTLQLTDITDDEVRAEVESLVTA